MLVLSNEEIESLVTVPDCLAVLEEAYRDLAVEKAANFPRVDNLAPCGRDGAYYAFKYMGGLWREVAALRLNSDIVTHPEVGGAARRVKLPLAPGGRWVGLVELFSTRTGELLAVFPDGVAQRLRVGAANALAARFLARPDASRVGLIGCGWQAGAQLAGLLAARRITEVRVYSLRPSSREAFVAAAAVLYPETAFFAAETAAECVRGADIIAAATSSMVPVIEAGWLAPGVHAGCIKTQEVDAAVLAACDRVVVHTKSQVKQIDRILPGTPHVIGPHRRGWWNDADWSSFTDLPELVAGQAPGRRTPGEVTCFVNNVGLGLSFAAVGALILQRAGERGLGRQLPAEWFAKDGPSVKGHRAMKGGLGTDAHRTG